MQLYTETQDRVRFLEFTYSYYSPLGRSRTSSCSARGCDSPHPMQRQKHLGNASHEVRDGENQKGMADRPDAEEGVG